ncbi:MAG: MarR family transcriptional regulator [Lentisphaeria bacterium]|nr:MarR family transcriptional regulator [Lentisphaeria bacterium]NQZ68457.1 MarR family transcriptional regulator [Lentisphaeria bacterium]
MLDSSKVELIDKAIYDISVKGVEIQGSISEFLKNFKLSTQQYHVLVILRESGTDGLPSLEISKRLVNKLPDITRIIDRMVHTGLVRRNRSAADRRVVNVKITDHGNRILSEIEPPIRNIKRQYFTKFEEGEIQGLISTLRLIKAN